MAPSNPKVIAAFRAMTNLGIHESKVKPVLKKLIKLYERNWALIEEENYRALVDAIFEDEDNQEGGIEAEAPAPVEQVRPLKRLRLRGQDGQFLRLPTSGGSPSLAVSPVKSRLPTSGGSPKSPAASSPLKSRGSPTSPASSTLISPKPRPGTVTESGSELQPQSPSALSRSNAKVDKGKKPVSPVDTSRRRKSISDRSPSKEPAVEPGTSPSPKTKTPHPYPFIIPKPEPIDEQADYEVPISMVFPGIQLTMP